MLCLRGINILDREERQFGKWWAYRSAKNCQNWTPKVQKVTMIVHANSSQMVDDVAAAATGWAMVPPTKLSDDLNMPHVNAVHCTMHPDTTQPWQSHEHMQWPDWYYYKRWDLSQLNDNRRCIMFSVLSLTEATIGHLESLIIIKKEETVTG